MFLHHLVIHLHGMLLEKDFGKLKLLSELVSMALAINTECLSLNLPHKCR